MPLGELLLEGLRFGAGGVAFGGELHALLPGLLELRARDVAFAGELGGLLARLVGVGAGRIAFGDRCRFACLQLLDLLAKVALLVGETAPLDGEFRLLAGEFGLESRELLLEFGGFFACALPLRELLLEGLRFGAGGVAFAAEEGHLRAHFHTSGIAFGAELGGLLACLLGFDAGGVALGEDGRLGLLLGRQLLTSLGQFLV